MSEDIEAEVKEEVQRRLEEQRRVEREEKLIKEIHDYLASDKYIKGTKSTTAMMEEIDDTAEGDNIESAGGKLDIFGGKFSAFGLLMDVFKPALDAINGLLDIFVGAMMTQLKPAFEKLFDVLSSQGVQDAIKFVAELFTNVLSPVIGGIAAFISLVTTGAVPEGGGIGVGEATGTVIGAIIGAAIASYIGMPWLGGVIGAWVGGQIGKGWDILDEEPETFREIDEPRWSWKRSFEDLAKGVVNWWRSIGGAAEGGIFTQSTFTQIGEAGPEAVIPLDKFDDVMGGGEGLELIKASLIAQNEILTSRVGIQRRRFG